MDKTENGRQTISWTIRRLLSIALVITLAVVVTNAQVGCLGICEQNLAQCLRNQGSDPPSGGSCLENYENCVEDCLGSAGAILG